MKKGVLSIMCAASILLSATACGNNAENNNNPQVPEYTVATEYNLNDYIKPLWEEDIITHESIMFMDSDEYIYIEKDSDPNGLPKFNAKPVSSKKLLYPADEIYSVYSYDMKTEYIKGRDWDIYDGKIVRYSDSEIPLMTEDFYYPETTENGAFESDVTGHKYILFGERDTMTKWQVVVTYKHSGIWNGPMPTVQSEKIKSFIEKLEKGEEVTIVFYGDSITTGANSSGPMGITPNAPSFAQMITDYIAEKYGYTVSKEADPFNLNLTANPFGGEKVIHYINTAVGGTTSTWGREELEERVLKYEPDLMILAFGMNEGGDSMEKFTSSISELIGRVQAECPETDTVVVSTMMPHFRVKGFYGKQEQQEDALRTMIEENTLLNTSKIALAEVSSAHKFILENKEYYDMTGNNVNHPNDFLARIYAHVILTTMFGDYYN